MLESNKSYENIYFSGCGFLNMYQIGSTLCLIDNNIRFNKSYSTSAGFVSSIMILKSQQSDNNTTFIEFLIFSILRCRFSNSFYFGKEHMSNVIKALLYTMFENFDIKNIYPQIYIGVRTLFNSIKFENKWLTNFTSDNDFVDAITSSTRLLPFISLLPTNYNGDICMDQVFACGLDTNNSEAQVSITPFNCMILPKSKIVIQGDNSMFNIRKILNPTIHEMFKDFICGYNDTYKHIINPISKRDIYEYSFYIYNKNKNCDFNIPFPDIYAENFEYFYKIIKNIIHLIK